MTLLRLFAASSLVYLFLILSRDFLHTSYVGDDTIIFAILKCLPIWILIGVARISSTPEPNSWFTWLVIFGLGFSSLGDFALALSDKWFVVGLAMFLVAHLFYIAAFGFPRKALHFARGLPFFALAAGLYYFLLLPKLPGVLVLPVAVYVSVISTMVWRAAARVGEGKKQEDAVRGRPRSVTEELVVKRPMGQEGSEWTAFIGAIVFMVSDLVLAVNKFVVPFQAASLLTMTTYYLGQVLIASSVNRKPLPKPKTT